MLEYQSKAQQIRHIKRREKEEKKKRGANFPTRQYSRPQFIVWITGKLAKINFSSKYQAWSIREEPSRAECVIHTKPVCKKGGTRLSSTHGIERSAYVHHTKLLLSSYMHIFILRSLTLWQTTFDTMGYVTSKKAVSSKANFPTRQYSRTHSGSHGTPGGCLSKSKALQRLMWRCALQRFD